MSVRLAYRGMRLMQRMRRAYYRALSNNQVNGKPLLHQPVQFVGNGSITFMDNVRIGVFPSPFFLSGYSYIEARTPSSSVFIDSDTWINNNFVAIAEFKNIVIGKRVLIGTSVEIIDSNFHGLAVHERMSINPDNASDVVIEDDVFIGDNVKVLKGVRIGKRSVIGYGSVVTRDLPPGVVAAGNPVRVNRAL